MGEGRRWQFQLWWLMALVAVSAVLIGVITLPLGDVALWIFLALVFGFLFGSAYFLAIVLPYFFLIHLHRCPACGSRLY